MAPLLADVSQSQALRLYQVECLARCSRAAVDASTCLSASDTTHPTDGVLASPPVYIQIVKTAGVPRSGGGATSAKKCSRRGIDCRGPLNGRGGRLKRSSCGWRRQKPLLEREVAC